MFAGCQQFKETLHTQGYDLAPPTTIPRCILQIRVHLTNPCDTLPHIAANESCRRKNNPCITQPRHAADGNILNVFGFYFLQITLAMKDAL